jgi:hypothetical protein
LNTGEPTSRLSASTQALRGFFTRPTISVRRATGAKS